MAQATIFAVKVNGVEMETPNQKMIAHDLLELAEKKGAIPGKWNEYILVGDKGEYKQNDEIDLSEDSVFITLRDRPTQVA